VVQDGPGRKLWRRVPDGSARFAGTAGAAPGRSAAGSPLA